MLDIHTHILPRMDDGSDSLELSLQMLREEYAQGITVVAATPHFFADQENPDSFLKRRERAYDNLAKAMEKCSETLPEIRLGAEVQYYEGISQSSEISRLTIEGTSMLLLEMPFTQWTDRMLREVARTQHNVGVQVVLAHVERYFRWQNPFTIWSKIESTGALVQCNASFFIQRSSRRKALRLLDAGKIDFIGSDCHNCSVRPPNIGEIIPILEEQLGHSAVEWIEQQKQFG